MTCRIEEYPVRSYALALLVAAGCLSYSLPTAAALVDSGVIRADFAAPAALPPTVAKIYQIQGGGARSPLLSQSVTATGVVTRLNNNGFFMQDPAGDGDEATSDGIFVFTGSTIYPAAAPGNLVSVTATVIEFDAGALPTALAPTPTVTQLANLSKLDLLGNGHAITPRVVDLPEAGAGGLERFEGMLVTLTGPFTIAQNHLQGRYGQLILGFEGRFEIPTNRFRPGSPQALALAAGNARRRIILDDGSNRQNPRPTPYLNLADALPRAGDQVGSITGVIDFGLATGSDPGPGDYRVHPTVEPNFSVANPRSSVPPPVGGSLRIASFNLLNYFTTFRDGETADGLSGQGCRQGAVSTASNCRGANDLPEFQRQRAKIIEAISAIDADVLGLMEIQNNGDEAVRSLVDAINAKLGARTYASVALPSEGTGRDAIRVAMIFKPASLRAIGTPVSDIDSVNNRPTLAQTFEQHGERFVLFVNHLKSKGFCPSAAAADSAGNLDGADGQGCWNARRLAQAERLRRFVAERRAASGSDKVLLIGDFNAYAQEDPICDLTSRGFVDLIERFNEFGYSYVFDGAAGRLDHAIASGPLVGRVTGAAIWHINADETMLSDYNLEFKAPKTTCGGLCPTDPYQANAYRSSDHDPLIVGLDLNSTPGSDSVPEQSNKASNEKPDISPARCVPGNAAPRH